MWLNPKSGFVVAQVGEVKLNHSPQPKKGIFRKDLPT